MAKIAASVSAAVVTGFSAVSLENNKEERAVEQKYITLKLKQQYNFEHGSRGNASTAFDTLVLRPNYSTTGSD